MVYVHHPPTCRLTPILAYVTFSIESREFFVPFDLRFTSMSLASYSI